MSKEHNAQITVQRRELSGVLGSDTEDVEILGRAMVYRAGDVLVPRDWLLGRCDDLDVPESIWPSETTPHSAYKRTMSRLVTSNVQTGDLVRSDVFRTGGFGANQPLRVEMDLKDGNRNVRHLAADVFFPEGVSGVEGGQWSTHTLGHFDYDADRQSVRAWEDNACPDELEDLWKMFTNRAEMLHETMMESHTGDDLRHMIYLNMILNSPPEWPNIIPLIDRGGLYFVPEGPLTDVIDSLAVIFREANEHFKVGGAEMAIRTLEVVDSDEKREWIRSRVEQALEEMVDDVLDDAFEAFDDGEETADEVVKTVAERLDAEAHNAEQYNDLLQAKLEVESMLSARAEATDDDEKQEIIERAMNAAAV